MTAKAAEMQREVRENAEDYQNYLKDLYSWESEIKVKDELLKKASQSPNIVGEQVHIATYLFSEVELTILTLLLVFLYFECVV
jgi:hypothetical protein